MVIHCIKGNIIIMKDQLVISAKRWRRFSCIIAVAPLALMLTGCGQSGPLYLPPANSAPPQKTQQAEP